MRRYHQKLEQLDVAQMASPEQVRLHLGSEARKEVVRVKQDMNAHIYTHTENGLAFHAVGQTIDADSDRDAVVIDVEHIHAMRFLLEGINHRSDEVEDPQVQVVVHQAYNVHGLFRAIIVIHTCERCAGIRVRRAHMVNRPEFRAGKLSFGF